jgi:DNA-directed RNA polymerase subunit E'/Rpb7
MQSPYFNTTLELDVKLFAKQMDNNIYDNIKQNIEKIYLDKCYNDFGYIDKIYNINEEIKGGVINAEDFSAAAIFRVKFNCKICNPLKNTIIMGKIISINNRIIVANMGPIKFIIQENNFNVNNIQFKRTAYYPMVNNIIINKPITTGTYVMIKVLGKKIIAGNTTIIVFGSLESVVDEETIEENIKNQYEVVET